jgi:hypothetical protein
MLDFEETFLLSPYLDNRFQVPIGHQNIVGLFFIFSYFPLWPVAKYG